MPSARRGSSALVALVALIALALGALYQLFELRLTRGDVYPAYSSLRADPLGTKVLYEALSLASQARVSRNYRDPPTLPEEEVTLLLLGVDPLKLSSASAEDAEALERIAAAGGRIVLSFLPTARRPSEDYARRLAARQARPEAPRRASELGVALGDRWGFRHDYAAPGDDPANHWALPRTAEAGPEAVYWRTALFFEPGEHFEVLYERQGRPVILERRFGKGSIVLSADSYFLSNEALRVGPHPALIARLVSASPAIVFDEAHFGIAERPGFMTFARRYRLEGLFLALLVLGALYVWRSSSSFLPSRELEDSRDVVSGKAASAGLVNLLRRSIPPRELLATCLSEWERSCARARPEVGAELPRLRALVAAGSRPDVVALYARIASSLGRLRAHSSTRRGM